MGLSALHYRLLLLMLLSSAMPFAACIDLSDPATYGGVVVNNSGLFTITGNALFCGGGPYYFTGDAFNISGSNIVVDCGWMSLLGDGSGPDAAFTWTKTSRNVTVKNCEVNEFLNAVRVYGTASAAGNLVWFPHVFNFSVSRSTYRPSLAAFTFNWTSGFLVQNNTVSNMPLVVSDGSNWSNVTANRVFPNGFNGMHFVYGVTFESRQPRITGNYIEGANIGILMECQFLGGWGMIISSNTINLTKSYGIEYNFVVPYTTISSNTIVDTANHGVYMHTTSSPSSNNDYLGWVTSNTVTRSNGSGIYIDIPNANYYRENQLSIGGNTVTNTSGYGIYTSWSPYDYVYGNKVSGSKQAGIYAVYATSMAYFERLYHNIYNNEVWNSSHGIYVTAAAAPNSWNYRIYNNKLYNNSGYGLYFYSAASSSHSLVRNNTMYGNTDYGMYLYAKNSGNNANWTVSGIHIYNQTKYLYMNSYWGDVAFSNMTLSVDGGAKGKVFWPNASITAVGADWYLLNTNVIVNPDFISVNATHPGVKKFNTTANVSVATTSCTGTYLKYEGFPRDVETIRSSGTPYSPKYSDCNGTEVVFQTDGGFSGYAFLPPSSPYDFAFLPGTMAYDPTESLTENTFVSFSAMLNVTTNESLSLNVTLFVNDTGRNSSVLTFDTNETRNVSLGWSVLPGNHTATLSVDPGGLYPEPNETNNNISVSGVYVQKVSMADLVSPLNRTYIVRGKDIPREDSWDVVANTTTVVARILDYNHMDQLFEGVCNFFFGNYALGTNSTVGGICSYAFDKSQYPAGLYGLFMNYTISEENVTYGAQSSANISVRLNIINATANPLNAREDGQYMRGDALITNITVYNDSVPFDPPDFVVFIGGSSLLNCPSGSLPSESDAWFVMRKSQASSHPSAGSYLMLSVLNDSHDEDVHWCLYVNDSTGAFISSSSHQDVGIDPSTAYLNVSILNASAGNLTGASVQLYDRNGYQLENRAITGELYRPGARFDNYTLIARDNGSQSIRFDNFNLSGPQIQVPVLFANGYSGQRPFSGAGDLPAVAFITNSSFLNYSNPSANITLSKSARVRQIYKCETYDPVTMDCTSWASASYSNLGQNSTHVWFTVSSFSGYAAGPDGADLAVWDSGEPGMPYGDRQAKTNRTAYFFGNYTNLTGGAILPSADQYGNCTINFSDGSVNYSWYNSTKLLYEFSRNFSAPGTYYYTVSCNSSGWAALNASDSIEVIVSAIPAVAEPAMSPPTAYKNTTLYCNTTITDGDDETGLTVEFQFWNFTTMVYETANSSMLNNSVVWATVPNAYFNKSANISCRVRGYDGSIYSNWSGFSNNITILNSPPVWNPGPRTVSANSTAGSEYFLHCSDDDPEDVMFYSINDTLAGKLSLAGLTGNLSWNVFNESEAYTYDMNYSCSDDQINVSYYGIYQINDTTMPFSFREENSSNPVYRLSNMSFNISFTDWKGGDTAVFYFDDGVGSFSNYSIFSWRDEINRNFSVNRTVNALTAMTVRWYWWANDTYNNSNTTVEHSFVVPNRKPSNATIADIAFPEDSNYTLNLSLFFNDTDGERLTYSVNLSSTDSSHNVNYTFWEIGDNVTLVPAPDYYGSEWVIFQAKDNANDTNQSNRITVDVLSVPDPPRFVSVTFNPAGPTDMTVFAIMVNVTSETGLAGLINCTTNSTVSQLDGISGSAAAGGNRLLYLYAAYVPVGNNYFTVTCTDANGPTSYTSNITVSAEPTDLIAYASELTISPINPASDTPFSVSLKVGNIGVHNASNVNVSFYKDGAYAGSTSIPFIDTSMNRTTTPILLTFSTTGLHVLKAIIDPESEIPDVSRTNNQVSKSVKVGQSNLTYFINITDLVVGPSSYRSDGRIMTDDYFYVQGRAVAYYPPFDSTMVQGGSVLVTVNGVNYSGYTDSDGDFRVTGMSISTPGTYQITTNVTDGNVYGDNSTLTVTIYAREEAQCAYPDYLPDLFVSHTSRYTLNDTPIQNVTIEFSPIVVNYYCGDNGTAPANFSRSFNVSFYMDSAYLGRQTVYTNISYATSLLVPQSIISSTQGIHTLWGVIDADNEIPESDETNNAFNFSIRFYPIQPDLRVTDVLVSQAPFDVLNASVSMAFANRPMNFTVRVENWGGTATRYNLSLSEGGADFASALANISKVGVTGYITRQFLSGPFGAATAMRNVTSLANSTDHPDDPNPYDNHLDSIFYVYERPDVWVSSFSMQPNSGSPGSERISPVDLDIDFTIENFGVVPTPAPFNITIEDMYDGSRPVFTYRFNDSIGANFSTAAVSVTLTGFTNGTHKIRVYLDSGGELDEIYKGIGTAEILQNSRGYNTYIPYKIYIYPSAPVVLSSYTRYTPYAPGVHNAETLTLYTVNQGALPAYRTNISAIVTLPNGTVEYIHDYSIASLPEYNGNQTEVFQYYPRTPGNHRFSALVNSSGGIYVAPNITVGVMHPDMRIISDNIVFSQDAVMLNQSVNATIAISNQDSSNPAYNVTVNLSVNGFQVNRTVIPYIAAGSSDFMTTNFTVNQSGYQVVLVSVNELWKSFEADEDDNTATKATLFAYNTTDPNITFNEFSTSYLSGTKLFKANVTDFDNDTSLFDVYFYWVNLTDSSKNYMFHSASALSGNVKVPPGAYFGENYSTLLLPDGQYRFMANTTDLAVSAESTSRSYVVDNTPPAVNFDPQAPSMMREITEVLYNATDLYPYEVKWRYSSDGGTIWSSYSTVYYRPVNGSSYTGTDRNITFNPNVCGSLTEPNCVIEMYMQDMAGNYNTASISFRTKEAGTTVITPPDPDPTHDFSGGGRGACAPGYFNFTVSSSHNYAGATAKLYMHDGTGRITSDGLLASQTVHSDGMVGFYIAEPGNYIIQLTRPGFNPYHYTFALDACLAPAEENRTVVVTPPTEEEKPSVQEEEDRPPAPPLVPDKPTYADEPEKPVLLPDVGMIPALIAGASSVFPWLLLALLLFFIVTYSYWLRKYRSLTLGEALKPDNLRAYFSWLSSLGKNSPPPKEGMAGASVENQVPMD